MYPSHFCARSYRLQKLIFETFDLENIVQGLGGEKRYLCSSIANILVYIFIILAYGNIQKQTNFAYFKHLKSKM